MTAKKWIVSFFLTALGLVLALVLFNILTDPFGVFGDPIMHWWSYNETNNPRAAKITYLGDHLDEYDSYLVGCSSTSSFSVETLNAYYRGDASFYNMIMYGADMLDCEQTVRWLLENDEVKHIWLNVYLDNGMEYDAEPNEYTHSMHPDADGSNPVPFYLRYLFLSPEFGMAKLEAKKNDTWLAQSFDVFDEKTGAYDKRKRDIEPISDMGRYLEAYPVFADYPDGSGYTLPKTAECMASVGRIVDMCREAGAELTVVTAPVYQAYLGYFDRDTVAGFYRSLAEVTDFWDFSYSTVSCDPRYFYDSTHFRNDVGDMAIARIFGDDGVYIPEDFGVYVTCENAADVFTDESVALVDIGRNEADIPVLMYHHIDENTNSVTVTEENFESHMKALTDAGYTAVSMAEVYEYVMGRGTLPEKPVMITFDDGYRSNYELAMPILEKYGMKAVMFPIGSSVGKSKYKDADHEIIPHATLGEIAAMAESGVFEIGSHTYDMHQSLQYEIECGNSSPRIDMDRLDGEEEQAYLNAVRSDFVRSWADIQSATGENFMLTLAYPRGVWTNEAAAVLCEMGVKMTFSTEEGVHTVVRGLEQSLYGIRRFNVDGAMTADEILAKIGG